MTDSIQPLQPLQALPAVQPTSVASPGPAQALPSATPAQAAIPTTPAPAASPVSAPVQWTPQALQNLKLQAFEQLIAQLALQVQTQPGVPAARWATQGLGAAVQQWLQSLLAQVSIEVGSPGAATPVRSALMLQAGQPVSAAMLQTLAQALSQQAGSALRTAAAQSATAAAVLAQADFGALDSSATTGRAQGGGLPPLHNWWVQQGQLISPQGERGFALTLQVPAAWAQAVGAPRLTGLDGTSLRWEVGDLQALQSGPLALVIRPQSQSSGAAAWATSALLWLELQPQQSSAPGPAQGAASLVAAQALGPQLAQELLHNKSDPWLMMAAAQASNALPQAKRHAEHRSHWCTTQGCPYQGQAPCAQPFCSEMNRIWVSTRIAPGA